MLLWVILTIAVSGAQCCCGWGSILLWVELKIVLVAGYCSGWDDIVVGKVNFVMAGAQFC